MRSWQANESKLIELIQHLGELTFSDEKITLKTFTSDLYDQMMKESQADSYPILFDADNFEKFKECIGENNIGEYVIAFDVSPYQFMDGEDRQILNIKQSNTKFINDLQFSIITIEYSEDNNLKKSHFISKNNPEIKNVLELIKKSIPIEQIEEKLKRYYRLRVKPYNETFWDKDWSGNRYARKYDSPSGIDGVTINLFNKYIPDYYKLGDSPLIIDVGGGKGRVARKLIAEAEKLGVKLKYILIEPCKSQCEIAELNLTNYPHVVFAGTLQDFISAIQNKTSTEYKILKKKLLFDMDVDIDHVIGNVDLIVSSGGPFNTLVVSYEKAQKNAIDAFTMLCDHGAVIATGLTSLLLSKKDLERIGFNVQNCVASKLDIKISESTAYLPAYVMKKGSI